MARFVIEDDQQPSSDSRFAVEDGPRGIGAPEELTFGERLLSGVSLPDWMDLATKRDRLRGTAVEGFGRGMLKPFVGTVQAAANVVGAGDAINQEVDANEARYQAARKAQGREGIDAAELAGEVVSPFNAILATRGLGAGVKGWQAAKVGAAIGAGGAASQPVVGAEGAGDFFGQKSKQIGAGAATGAILTPAVGAVAERAVRWLRGAPPAVTGQQAQKMADDAIAVALKETGQTIDDVPAVQLERLRDEVTAALAGGKKLDAAAALRKADFESLGLEGTLGQITRDPTQYAKEKNLQSIAGVGDELTRRFSSQNARLAERINAPAAKAKDAYAAGTQLRDSLARTDETLGRHVSGLYREARAAAPGAGEVPLQGLAQDAADILRRYEGVEGTQGLRNILDDYGIVGDGMRQTRVFGFEDAEGLIKQINKLGGSKAQQSFASEMRDAVKRAITEASGGAGPFDSARRAAAERFRLQDAVPALKAAADGSVAPDDFVTRFVVRGKTDEVKRLGDVLKQTDAESWNEARSQLAEVLRRAAFGENPAGDAAFSPTRYMSEIRRIGPQKLAAFFNPKELQDIFTLGRVGAYMRSFPADSPVNTSRTAGALTWMASKIPGGNAIASVGQAAARTVKGSTDARRALAADIPVELADLTPRQQNVLALILRGFSVGGGALAGSAAR